MIWLVACVPESTTDGVCSERTWYADIDGDGFGDGPESVVACDAPVGFAAVAGDCAPQDSAAHPGAEEPCESLRDLDCDGFVTGIDADGDGTPACADCDDAVLQTHPGATEICNDVDDDCDGTVDEDCVPESMPGDGGPTYWFVDGDGDGWGVSGDSVVSDEPLAGYAPVDGDCDDADASVRPRAPEACNLRDDDCDTVVDESDPGNDPWYADADGDGFGDAAAVVRTCTPPVGAVSDGSDCDDADAGVNPGQSEICADEIDQDCDGGAGTCGIEGELSLTGAATVIPWVGGATYDPEVAYVDGLLLMSGDDASDTNGLVYGWLDVDGAAGGDSGDVVLTGAGSTWFGDEITPVGDVDGDGLGDLALMADRDRIAIFLAPLATSATTADAAGLWEESSLGSGPRALGDIDGDGLADVGTGPYWLGVPATGEGELGDAPYLVSDEYVAELAAAGDHDGDGFDDVLARDWGDSDEGVVCLVPGPVADGDVVEDLAVATFTGGSVTGWAGEALGTLGDLDDDGHDDIWIEEEAYDTTELDAGAAAIFYGPVSGAIETATADLALVGAYGGLEIGGALVTGDWDVDDVPDFAVSSSTDVYIWSGPRSGVHTTDDTLAVIHAEGYPDLLSSDLRADGVDHLVLADSIDGAAGLWIFTPGPGM